MVISEFRTRGPNGANDEFIELYNPGSTNVPLFDPAHPAHTWHIRNGVDFDFPTNITIPAQGVTLLDPVELPLSPSVIPPGGAAR